MPDAIATQQSPRVHAPAGRRRVECPDHFRSAEGELDGIVRLRAQWVFAYGSLIWHPGFPYSERHVARIQGYRRAFCITSTRYRGSPEAPGIVLGLDHGGSCQGIVYRIEPGCEEDTVELLYQREMGSGLCYQPILAPLTLADGRTVLALSFVARPGQCGYEALSREQVLERLRTCSGTRGPNRDYATNTWTALKEWGIDDAELAAIAQALGRTPR